MARHSRPRARRNLRVVDDVQTCQMPVDFIGITLPCRPLQSTYPLGEYLEGESPSADSLDLLDRGGTKVAGIVHQYFADLLALFQARDFNPHVSIRAEPGEFDQVLGQFVDQNGSSHIKHENVSIIGEGPRLNQQANRLWNGHQKTLRVTVS